MSKHLPTVLAVLLSLAAPAALAQATSTEVLSTTTTWDGAPIDYLRTRAPEVKAIVIEIAPGTTLPWHYHPVPNYAYVLEGTLTLELSSGMTRTVSAGQAVAEVVNTTHRGHNLGTVPVKLIVFYTGEVGTAVTVTVPYAARTVDQHLP